MIAIFNSGSGFQVGIVSGFVGSSATSIRFLNSSDPASDWIASGGTMPEFDDGATGAADLAVGKWTFST